MEFCKAFNAATQELERVALRSDGDHRLCGPQLLLHHQDPPGSFLLKKAADPEGSSETGKVTAATIRRSAAREIAEVKMKDLNANDLDAAARSSKAPPRDGLECGRAEPMAKLSKRQKALTPGSTARQFYGVDEALALVKATLRKFDETIEVALNLGVDRAMPTRWVRASSTSQGSGKTCASPSSPRAPSRRGQGRRCGRGRRRGLMETVSRAARSTSTA